MASLENSGAEMSVGVHLDVLNVDPNIAEDVEKAKGVFKQSVEELQGALIGAREADFYGPFGDHALQCLGRSALDHTSAGSLEELSRLADQKIPNNAACLEPLRRLDRPCLIMPFESAFPLVGPHCYVMSGHDILQALLDLAPALEIQVNGRNVPGAQAASINAMKHESLDELQAAWLMVFEASRLAIANRKAVVIA
jgi:hypothetical protein